MEKENVLDGIMESKGEEVTEEGQQEPIEETAEEETIEESAEESTPTNDFVSRLEELEKANKGLLETLKTERKKRQELQERFSQINEVLTAAQLRKQLDQEGADVHEEKKAIAIDFDEEGNPIIPVDHLKELLQEEIKPLQEEVVNSKAQQIQRKQIEQVRQEVNNILSEDPVYPKAMEELRKQWQDINTLFDNYLESTELPPPRDPQSAIDMLFSSNIEQEFKKRYPNADMESLVEAFMAVTPNVRQRKLRKALKTTANYIINSQENKERMNILGKLSNKSNFGSAPNQAGSATLNEMPDMRTFLSLSDAEAQKIYDLME